MVKTKKKPKNKNIYPIKTRNRIKKQYSMSREIKNLQETQWMANTTLNIKKNNLQNSPTSKKVNKKISKNFSKINKKRKIKKNLKVKTNLNKKVDIKKDNQNGLKSNKIYHNENQNNISFSKNSKKNQIRNIQKIENAKKISNDIYKYIYQNIDYFELKEVLGFLYDELCIDLDSSNNKIKNKDEFKNKMNDMFKKYFVIYYNKILITEENLLKFLEYLSKFVKFDANEVIKLLNEKCKLQIIEENISLQQYFKPTLFLVEK